VVKAYVSGALSLLSLRLHDGLGRSYLRHGLLLAVYAEVFKGHTYTMVYIYHSVQKCENCNISAKSRSSEGTVDSVDVRGPWDMRSGLILLVWGPRPLTRQILGHRNFGTAFRCVPAYFNDWVQSLQCWLDDA